MSVLNFNEFGDERGKLVPIENIIDIPFNIKRVFFIYDTKEGVSRGLHAHKTLMQVLVCVKGSCRILLDDGKKREVFVLDSPTRGLIVGKMVWHEMLDFSTNCVLISLADDFYKEPDYIRDYDEFVQLVAKT